MTNKQKQQPNDNLFIQLWRNPIFYGGLLTSLSKEDLQTLIGLAVFMNKDGECSPGLKRLGSILGLADVSSVSERISSLECLSYNGEPIITVTRRTKLNKKGQPRFATNIYKINKNIVSVFSEHPTTTVRRAEQAEKVLKQRKELSNSFSF